MAVFSRWASGENVAEDLGIPSRRGGAQKWALLGSFCRGGGTRDRSARERSLLFGALDGLAEALRIESVQYDFVIIALRVQQFAIRSVAD